MRGAKTLATLAKFSARYIFQVLNVKSKSQQFIATLRQMANAKRQQRAIRRLTLQE
jgi:hypothetical protein